MRFLKLCIVTFRKSIPSIYIATLCRIIKPRYQIYDRCFSPAGWTDYRKYFSLMSRKTDILENIGSVRFL